MTAPLPVSPRATDRRRLDEAVERLREGCYTFARLSLGSRIELARSMQAGYLRVAARSVKAAARAKRFVPGTHAEGEEWATGPFSVVRHLRLVQESLAALRRSRNTPVGPVRPTRDDRLAVRVFPGNTIDRTLFRGVTVDVHMEPGVDEERMAASRAAFHKSPDHDGRVTLILGAGNLSAIATHDLLTRMFNEGKVCVVKMSPVNAYLGPFLEEAFAEPISRNFLAIVYGGTNEGEYLAHHPGIDEVHLTGSSESFEMLVWGSDGPEREERKRLNAPRLGKPITAELGNVTPVLLLPGPYAERELLYQAQDVASALTFNASFNCNAPNVIITPAEWPRRDTFLKAIGDCLSRTPTRRAYYPGALERWRLHTADRLALRTFGEPSEESLPWTLAPGVDPRRHDDRAFTEESFCPILFETQVGGPDPLQFLDAAVTFANERLWGTLCAGLIVHPRSMRDPMIAEGVERAIARLRYGVVCVNAWSGLAFVLGSPPWGAYQGSTLTDIQSGRGWVHNSSMFEGIEKTVLRHPLTAFPKPGYFASHRTSDVMMRRLTRLEHRANWARVPGVIGAALRS